MTDTQKTENGVKQVAKNLAFKIKNNNKKQLTYTSTHTHTRTLTRA